MPERPLSAPLYRPSRLRSRKNTTGKAAEGGDAEAGAGGGRVGTGAGLKGAGGDAVGVAADGAGGDGDDDGAGRRRGCWRRWRS